MRAGIHEHPDFSIQNGLEAVLHFCNRRHIWANALLLSPRSRLCSPASGCGVPPCASREVNASSKMGLQEWEQFFLHQCKCLPRFIPLRNFFWSYIDPCKGFRHLKSSQCKIMRFHVWKMPISRFSWKKNQKAYWSEVCTPACKQSQSCLATAPFEGWGIRTTPPLSCPSLTSSVLSLVSPHRCLRFECLS